jgi:hypothetical protein
MNTGLEILLKRMDSHPQEFQDSHRWDALIETALRGRFLTDQERSLLRDKLSALQGESFTASVVRELVQDTAEFETRGATKWSTIQATIQSLRARTKKEPDSDSP